MRIIIFFVAFVNLTFTSVFPQGFLKTDGKKIVDRLNNEILLRGIGLGGWMLQEGYMLHTSAFANAEHQIRNKIADLIGEENTAQFYQAYHANYVTQQDIQKLAEFGFNSIRLPMHYNKLMQDELPAEFKEDGFLVIDNLLSWCEEYELYLILDLHAAPGGQSDEPISDYDPSKPSLWDSQTNIDMTIELWKEISRRYVNEEWIGGYDIINEPKWNLGTNNIVLRNFYEQITVAIREIDNNHIIFIEGNWFATDFAGLTPAWDDNMVYSFHKYWNTNDTGSIQYLLNIRNSENVPLWLGETGENSNVWFKECVELMEYNDIGWAWWPHKKIASIAVPYSAELTNDYQVLLDYWQLIGSKPTEAFAFNALMNQADKLKIENCTFHPDVIDALFRQQFEDTQIAFKDLRIPGIIFATDFNMGGLGVAYNDDDYQKIGSTTWNSGWEYRNEGVDIEKCSDNITNGFNVGWISSGEWLNYFVTIDEPGLFDLQFRIAANGGNGKIVFRIVDQDISVIIDIPVTGSWTNWQTVYLNNISLTAGSTNLSLQFLNGGFNLNYIKFEKQISTGLIENEKLPNELKLSQNYPNPFNSYTKINFETAERNNVKLNLYDVNGELVRVVLDKVLEKGKHSVSLNSKLLGSGIYYYSLVAGGNRVSKKAVLVK